MENLVVIFGSVAANKITRNHFVEMLGLETPYIDVADEHLVGDGNQNLTPFP